MRREWADEAIVHRSDDRHVDFLSGREARCAELSGRAAVPRSARACGSARNPIINLSHGIGMRRESSKLSKSLKTCVIGDPITANNLILEFYGF